MKRFGVIGRSGSGKTTLIARLVPELAARDVAVSTVKHTHHSIDIDKPGKDSYVHRQAGAREVMLVAPGRWALMHEERDGSRAGLAELLGHMTPVDLLLVEGFHKGDHDKLEVYRPSTGRPLLYYPRVNGVVAVASDAPLSGLEVPVLDLNDPPAIVDFILNHCGLGRK